MFFFFLLQTIKYYCGILLGAALNFPICADTRFVRMTSLKVRFTADLEANMRCIDRVRQRGSSSSSAVADDDGGKNASNQNSSRFAPPSPPNEWPNRGTLRFDNVDARHGGSTSLTLRRCSFDVAAGMTVGVTGLAKGEGQAAVAAVLMNDATLVQGNVMVDGVKLSAVTDDALRAGVAYIPEVPVLFAGKLRMNLDPQSKHTDSAIYASLERCFLREMVENLNDGLSTQVGQRGANFTPSEQRMLCMCRALLQGSKVLVVEDASPAPDEATDAKMQTVLRTAFDNCTKIIVSQRLLTIIDADLILSFDKGRLVECDTPAALIENSSGIVSQLLARLGDVAAQSLIDVVKGQ